MNPSIIKTPFLKICSYTITLSSIFLLYTVRESVIVSLPFTILGVLGIILSGKAEIDYNGFKVRTIIGIFYMRWASVEYIEIGQGNMIIGNSKQRISYPVPEYWGGKEIEKALEIFDDVLISKDIDIKESARAIMPLYYGTRVK